MKIFNNLTNLPLALAFVTGAYILHEALQENKVYKHPTLEFATIMLKQDRRVTNFCGRNYTIKKHRMINEDDSDVSYRLKIEGVRGTCKVLIKAKKHTHAELKSSSAEQNVYSKKSKEEKAISAYQPFNFNDVLIPTKETASKMSELLKAKNLSESQFLVFNRDAYIDGVYHSGKSDYNKALRKPIENADTFFRITSMTMVAEDNYVFNIRPIGANYRDYDVEDTVYQYKTYDDVLKKCMNLRFDFNERLKEDYSAEDYRNEIILYKQMKFQQRTQQRKYLMLGMGGLSFLGYMFFNVISRHRIDVATLKSLQSKIANLTSKSPLGNTKRLICIDYHYSASNQKFRVSGLAMGEKGAQLGFETTVVLDDVAPHEAVSIYTLNQKKGSKEKEFKISI